MLPRLPRSSVRLAAAVVLGALGTLACTTPASTARQTLDPVVTVHGPQGDELAVSTDYGVVFLGRSAKSGKVEYTVWFGDGPSREEGVVESVGGGVYATEGEITLPSVPLCFEPLPAGTPLIVRGRRGPEPFEIDATLATDARVTGILLNETPELARLTDADLGAGVFLVENGKPMQLVGMVSGHLSFPDRKRYVTAVGPEDLWHLVVHRRNSDRPRRWVYRADL